MAFIGVLGFIFGALALCAIAAGIVYGGWLGFKDFFK